VQQPTTNLPIIDHRIAAILRRKRVLRLEDDIWRMEARTLRTYFGAITSGRTIAKRMIRSIVWQVYERIHTGKMDPIEGNVRSFWYRFVKPTLARVGILQTAKVDHYLTMMQIFAEMVEDLDLFKYTAFGFDDSTWENRRIGAKHPTTIVFAEKAGFMRFLKEQVHAVYDVTVTALSGWPSILSTEYMARHIEKAGGYDPPEKVWDQEKVRLFSIVDWDPSGWMIREAFVRQLQDQGMTSYEMVDLIHPKSFTEEEIALYAYPVPSGPRQVKKNKRWLEATGGLSGRLDGLEADSMARETLRSLLQSRMA